MSQNRAAGPENAQVSKQRLVMMALVFGYAFLLNADYYWVEAPVHSDTGFVINTPSFWFVIAGYALAMIPALWMPTSIKFPSQIIYWWLYVVVFIPSMFVPYHVLSNKPQEVIVLQLALLAVLGLLQIFYFLRPIELPKLAINQRTFDLVWAAVLVLAVITLAITHGFDFDIPFADIYLRRFEARLSLPSGSFLSYIAALVYGAFVPISLAKGLSEKKISYLVMGIVAGLAVFILTALKSVIYLPFLFLAVRIALQRFPARFGYLMLIGPMVLLGLSMIEYTNLGTNYFSTYGAHRLLFVPAQLTAYHWQYYSDNSLAMFSNTIIGQLMGSERSLPPGQVIGQVYFNSATNNAGANIWASGFADLGYAGMVVVTICAGFIFRIIDGLSTTVAFLTACLTCVFIGAVWAESGLLTSFLSSGVLPCLLVLYFLSDITTTPARQQTQLAVPSIQSSYTA